MFRVNFVHLFRSGNALTPSRKLAQVSGFKTKLCTLPLHVKDIAGRTVTVYASAFGNKDSDGDIVMPGAFAKTLRENGPDSPKPRIKHLWQHSSWELIGKPTAMVEDAKGLLATSVIANTARGNDALALYELNLLEHSIGYRVVKSSRDEITQTTQLTELQLWEYSSVTWGANEDTPLVGMKSLTPLQQADKLADRWERIGKALRTGNLTDETCETLEIEIKQLQAAYSDIIATLSAKQQPEQSTDSEEDKPSEMDEAELLTVFKTALKLK